MPPDDAAFIDQVVEGVLGLMWAAHHGDQLRFVGELSLLLSAIIEKNTALRGEHPHNEALRRAVAALQAT